MTRARSDPRARQLEVLKLLAEQTPPPPTDEHYAYTPKIPPEEWQTIKPYTERVVQVTAPLTTYSEKELYPAASRLILFAWATANLPLEDEVVFAPAQINRFVQHHFGEYGRAGKNTMRARLRRMSEALLGEAASGSFRALGKSDASRPYTDSEIARLLSWVASQPSSERRTSAGALLALGFGVGLTGREIIGLQMEDITADAVGLVIRVRGDRERFVPVHPAWVGLLEERLSSGASTWAFREGQRGGNVNLVSDFTNRAPRPSVELQTRRMRASWVVGHLTRGTPLDVLMAGAGLQSAEALDRFLPFVPARNPSLRRALLQAE